MARYRVGLQTRARILQATRELLGEVGLENVTLKDITERAGVGAGSFYNLFDAKEDAVLEVLREAIAAVDPDPSGAGQESVDDLIDAFVRFMTGPSRSLARIHLQLAGTALTDDRVAPFLARSHGRRVERFAQAVKRANVGIPDDEAQAHAELLLGALIGLAMRWMLDDDFDFAGHVARLPRMPAPVRT